MILVEVWPFSSLHKDRLCLLRRFCKTAKLTGGWLRGVRYSAKRSWRGSLKVARRPRGNCGKWSWALVLWFVEKLFKKFFIFWKKFWKSCKFFEPRDVIMVKSEFAGNWKVLRRGYPLKRTRRFDGLAGALEEIGLREADVNVTPTL